MHKSLYLVFLSDYVLLYAGSVTFFGMTMPDTILIIKTVLSSFVYYISSDFFKY